MPDTVGCVKVPDKEKYYVCFTNDYRVGAPPALASVDVACPDFLSQITCPIAAGF